MPTPFELVQQEVQDEEMAWGWHCNIAMPIWDSCMDGKITHESANRAAANVMQHLFQVDITKTDNWKNLAKGWEDESP